MSEQPQIDLVSIDSLSKLREQVKELIGKPLSVWAVAAIIESLGVREIDAQKEFGYASIYELANVIYSDLKEEFHEETNFNSDTVDKGFNVYGVWEQVRLFIKYYSRGLLFSLPMISQVVAIFIFRYSLWAWLGFNEAQATIVAFGTIMAFVVTGGFIQVLGRSLSSSMNDENFLLAYESTKIIIKTGVYTVGGVAVIFYLINMIIPFYPQQMLLLGLVYMVLISLLLLASGVLYALKRRISILMIILAGTLLVIFNMDVLNLGIYASQWIAMLITVILLSSYALFYFKPQIQDFHLNLVKQGFLNSEVRYYINYRYFIYGSSYFLFLFLDRILAWSAGDTIPYIIWFNTPYELGMDWALITLVLSIAVLEYSVHAFSEALIPMQERATFSQLDQFNIYFKRLYKKQLFLLTVVGLVSIIVTYYAVHSLIAFQDDIPEIQDFFADFMTTKVFWIASISYLFVNIGLLHSLFFFTLSKPAFAMNSLLAGLVVNLCVGYLCSRIIALEYATLGLLAGSVVYALVSGVIARRFFKRLDYYYYSAF